MNLIDVNNIKNFLNQTLLHFACENTDIKLCKYLLNYGADCLIEDNYRQTPFTLAAKSNCIELIIMFSESINNRYLDTQINFNEINASSSKSMRFFFSQIRKALYHACECGYIEIIKYIFEKFMLKSDDLFDYFEFKTMVNILFISTENVKIK